MMLLQFTPPASLLFLVVMSAIGSELVVHYKQHSICALKGSTVSMGCTYPSRRFFIKAKFAFWSKEKYTAGMTNEPADLSLDPEYRDRVQYIKHTSGDCNLRLSNVTEQDQRKYYALILMTNAQKLNGGDGVELSVTDLQVEMIADRVLKGDSVTLTCKTTCTLPDTPTFTWYKNGRVLYYYNRNQLNLTSVSEKDAGSYSCAVNGQSYQSPDVTLNVGYPPKSVSVSISPSGEIVRGSSVSLTCSSDAKPRVHDYSWYKEMAFIATGTTYNFYSISSADSGYYWCKASNQYGEGHSKVFFLNVLDPPKSVSVSVSPSGDILEGSSVTLTCHSDANPPVEYNWFKGTVLKNGGKIYTIKKISSEDSGDYKCKAKNQYGERSSDEVTVNVLYPPKRVSVSISPSGEIVEGRSVTLTCHSDANPPVHDYTWYKGNTFIQTKRSYVIDMISSEDSGNYICKAKNKLGLRSSSAVSLNVLYPPKSVSVSISPSGDILEGSSVTLTCHSDANPPVEYNWFKGTVLKNGGKIYTIKKISSEDSGDYKCKAKNQYGERSSDEVTVNVLYPPKRVSVSISPSGEIVEGRSVTLTCSSDANPPVHDYTWYKGNTFIQTKRSYVIDMISSEDSGIYICKAKNKLGLRSSSAVSLNVLYPPKRVSVSISLSGEVVEGSSVNLTCRSDANPPAHDYTWYKVNESSPVGSGRSYSFMMNFSSSGWFYCVAQNKYGSQRAAAVPLSSNVSQTSGQSLNFMVVCVAVGVCVCVCGAFIAGIFCMRRKKQRRNRVKHQDGATHTEDNTYASLDHMTRSSNDVYSTLATVHSKPPDNTYAALDLQPISSVHETLTKTTRPFIGRL